MAETESEKNPLIEVNNQINVPGEGVDKAAADLLRTALGAPAAETSGLVGDLIGLFGDRVKLYRAEKRIQVLSDARQRLAERGVALEDASVPIEGLVYDAIEGMASAHTPELADLWAGLLANALDPNTSHNLDASYMEILRSLTPTDALILHFIALVESKENELSLWHREGVPSDAKASTEEIRAFQIQYAELAKSAQKELYEMYTTSPISELDADGLSLLNVFRLSLVQQTMHSADTLVARITTQARHQEMQQMFKHLEAGILEIEEAIKPLLFSAKEVAVLGADSLAMNIKFTSYGREFAAACDMIKPT